MNGKENNRRSPMPIGTFMMRLACILFCLVMFSFYLTGGLYARYTTSDTGSDSARVAAFHVLITGAIPDTDAMADAVIEPSENEGVYNITVQNKSEVAIEYDIYLELQEKLPAGVSVSIEGEDGATLQNDDKTHAFMNVNTLAVGAPKATHKMKFSVDWNTFTKDATGPSVEIPVNFKVRVVATQID